MAKRKVDTENRGFKQEQLEKKGKDFMASSLAVDESSDIRGDSSLNVTEEFLALRPVHGTTTGQDLYEEVSRCGNEMELPREKLVGWTTDGAAAMCGHRSGLVAKIREKMQEENVTAELTAHHCIIHLESLCAEALNMEHGMFTITHAGNFIRAKGLIQRQFKAFLSQLQTQRGDLPHHTEASCARVMGFEHVMTPVVKIINSIRSRAKQLRTFKVLLEELPAEYGDLLLHTEIRWLSRGRILLPFLSFLSEIKEFMQSRGEDAALLD
ncbi:SCAN domain-containing protein 3 [Takifugu flavidus]|uniref:SCAN domain-containing protein 3 n=1 Tax=Takifugu flavidus TaxID=433684 RepID=A0A5C6P519_9TELE|nr:SCAN domain-containing protein 3 [Takifugu flavidus]